MVRTGDRSLYGLFGTMTPILLPLKGPGGVLDFTFAEKECCAVCNLS